MNKIVKGSVIGMMKKWNVFAAVAMSVALLA
ncbi:MAG: hypothetical protein K0Q63_3446, partial [Paenibacillus sp.]|nr:hypothetical protein [Paenibacillus sp.]